MSEKSLADFEFDTSGGIPLPEQIIKHLKGEMIYIDTPEGQRFYSVRDWVFHVSDSQAGDKTFAWANLKRAIKKDLAKAIAEGKSDPNLTVEGLLNLQPLEADTPGGKQRMDFTNEEGLYQITQRMSDRSAFVRNVKTYLAKAGVFMGEAYLNPGQTADVLQSVADRREYNKLIAEGFTHDEALEWLDVRTKQKEQRRILTAIWKVRGIRKKNDYADLSNHVHRIALGLTATRHKRELAIKDTPRNHISAADNATLEITEYTSGLLHTHRNSFGRLELEEDVEDVRPIIDAARPEIQKAFSKKPRRLHIYKRPLLPD